MARRITASTYNDVCNRVNNEDLSTLQDRGFTPYMTLRQDHVREGRILQVLLQDPDRYALLPVHIECDPAGICVEGIVCLLRRSEAA